MNFHFKVDTFMSSTALPIKPQKPYTAPKIVLLDAMHIKTGGTPNIAESSTGAGGALTAS